jgi:hypothetical protein
VGELISNCLKISATVVSGAVDSKFPGDWDLVDLDSDLLGDLYLADLDSGLADLGGDSDLLGDLNSTDWDSGLADLWRERCSQITRGHRTQNQTRTRAEALKNRLFSPHDEARVVEPGQAQYQIYQAP